MGIPIGEVERLQSVAQFITSTSPIVIQLAKKINLEQVAIRIIVKDDDYYRNLGWWVNRGESLRTDDKNTVAGVIQHNLLKIANKDQDGNYEADLSMLFVTKT